MVWPWQVAYPHLRTKSNGPSDRGYCEHVTCECVKCYFLYRKGNRLQSVLTGLVSHSSGGTVAPDCSSFLSHGATEV